MISLAGAKARETKDRENEVKIKLGIVGVDSLVVRPGPVPLVGRLFPSRGLVWVFWSGVVLCTTCA